MDAKVPRAETALDGHNNNGNINYAAGDPSFHYAEKNKSYHDMGSNTVPKVEVPPSRPCAVVGPDRAARPGEPCGRARPGPWPHPRPPDYPAKLPDYQQLNRNISPRQTFQENMQRIMVPPRSLASSEDAIYTSDKNVQTSKNIPKLSLPSEAKYCDVPYTISPLTNEQKSARTSVPNVNPNMMRGGWPPGGAAIRGAPPYAAHEMYQYPEYSNCVPPRALQAARPAQPGHEEQAHVYTDPYRGGNIRYEPYPSVKDRTPRYEYINYPTYSPHHYPPKYQVPKMAGSPAIPPAYPGYHHVAHKYVREPHGYQRSPNPQPNYNVPYHNQGMYPNYGPPPGNCMPNKMYAYPSDSPYNSVPVPKPPYDNSKTYVKYDNLPSKQYPSENMYLNDLTRSKMPMSMPNFPPGNMHQMPSYPYYRKDVPLRTYDLAQFKNAEAAYNTQMSRIQPQFSSNVMSPMESKSSSDINTFAISPEDCGYASQSSTTSIRSTDSAMNMYYQYGHMNRGSPVTPRSEADAKSRNKDKKGIDVRQFLSMWNEGEEENTENTNKEGMKQTNTTDAKTNSELYVLGLVNVPSEELAKYEHIQKVSKLPENIKGYSSIDLLNQFEEVIESSNINNYRIRTPNTKEVQIANNTNITKTVNMQSRPLSPLDVESKISQSVIHKEVGCNFEIKPCSPKMLNVEMAAPVQTIIEERIIEKVTNQIVQQAPNIVPNSENNKGNTHVTIHQNRPLTTNENSTISSCKMAKTQFVTDASRLPEKSNYSLHDLESNSGVCLASLPRLDNEIELSFPEVNQQFINANKTDSVIAMTSSDIPIICTQGDETKNKHDNETKEPVKSPFSPGLKEQSRLSKYRKSKTNKEFEHSSYINAQASRTDSVIIKNPENYEKSDNIPTKPMILTEKSETVVNLGEVITSPINLALTVNENVSTSESKSNCQEIPDCSENFDQNRSSCLENHCAINLSLDYSNKNLINNCEESEKICDSNSSKVDHSENKVIEFISNKSQSSSVSNYMTTEMSESVNNIKKYCPDSNQVFSNELTNVNSENSEYDLNTTTKVSCQGNDFKECKSNDYESDSFEAEDNLDKPLDKPGILRLLEERVNDLPDTLLTPLSDSTINDASQDAILSDTDNFDDINEECILNCRTEGSEAASSFIGAFENRSPRDLDQTEDRSCFISECSRNILQNVPEFTTDGSDKLNMIEPNKIMDCGTPGNHDFQDETKRMESDVVENGSTDIPSSIIEDKFKVSDEEIKNEINVFLDDHSNESKDGLENIDDHDVTFTHAPDEIIDASVLAHVTNNTLKSQESITDFNCVDSFSERMCDSKIPNKPSSPKSLNFNSNDDHSITVNKPICIPKACNWCNKRLLSLVLQNLILYPEGFCSIKSNLQCTNGNGLKTSDSDIEKFANQISPEESYQRDKIIVLTPGTDTCSENVINETPGTETCNENVINETPVTETCHENVINEFPATEGFNENVIIENISTNVADSEEEKENNCSADYNGDSTINEPEFSLHHENRCDNIDEIGDKGTEPNENSNMPIDNTCDNDINLLNNECETSLSSNPAERPDVQNDTKDDTHNKSNKSAREQNGSNFPLACRRTLKRSLSESALNTNSYDEFRKQTDSNCGNRISLWPNKRKRTNDTSDDESNSSSNENNTTINRRKSMSSAYHEGNISFCILIDNDCILTEDQYSEGTVCFANIQEEDYDTVVSNQFEPEDLECQSVDPVAQEDVVGEFSEPFEMIDKVIDENWVEDVACVETVVTDDAVEDDDDEVFMDRSSRSSPGDDMFDHTDKIKTIYGDEMCSGDIDLIKTLYATPQMNMNKTLQGNESLAEIPNQHEDDELERLLSGPGDNKDVNESQYVESDDYVNDHEEQVVSTEHNDVAVDDNNDDVNENEPCEVSTKQLSSNDAVHFCENGLSEPFSRALVKNDSKYKRSSASPEVSSTTEEKKSGILLKITNYNGSRMSHLNNIDLDSSKRIRCKFTENSDYSVCNKDSTARPLITKAAQKYIPPIKETIRDLKVKLFLPQPNLMKLKQLKLCKEEPKVAVQRHLKNGRPNFNRSQSEIVKKPKPKFEDVLMSIDEIQIKQHKEKSKKRNSIPKVIIKKTENGSHYASSSAQAYTPDLTGRKWQPWVFLDKNTFIDKMALKGKKTAIFCRRKNTYVLSESFHKYKAVGSANFVISRPKPGDSPAPLKYTIKLKQSY
ncbi:unnamed protein product [Plutella xylostella]|uniref:(diamondback moth) hypothetical protein n=1 Tax=Plutella xylostella TaxID=51655 RepID=A0A8S4FW35_PLUXY|nr:unnamed protein product [Plutella xylostella]